MRPILARAAAAALFAFSACHGGAPRPADAAGAPRPDGVRAEAGAPADVSVYELPAAWRDQAGQTRELLSLAGRVQVVAMGYTHCAHTCPLIGAEFKRIEASLTPEERAKTGFVFVSIDSERDTPERMAEFARVSRLDPARWTLLSGDDDDVREMAALLGMRYRHEAGDEFSHSNAYLVLDGDGRIVFRRDGLGEEIDTPLARIRAAVAALPAKG